ncbi:MAG: L-2-amino-thiazoline-4-carboxylic acid hydrolase [Bradyrhizobium sp.]
MNSATALPRGYSGLSEESLFGSDATDDDISAAANSLADALEKNIAALRAARTSQEVERALRHMLRHELLNKIVVRDVFNIGLSRYYVAAKTLIEHFGEAGKKALGEEMTEFFRSRGGQMTHLFADHSIPGMVDSWADGFGAMGVRMEVTSLNDQEAEMHVTSCPFVDMWRRQRDQGASMDTLNFLQQSIEDWGWTPIANGYNPEIYARCERSMWLGERHCTIKIRPRRDSDPKQFGDRILQPTPTRESQAEVAKRNLQGVKR